MGVENHLNQDERIVSSFEPYYATSKRVLLYNETDSGPEVRELPYSRLERVEEVKVSDHRLMASGTVLAIAGFISAFGLGLYTPVIAVVSGIAMVIYGGIGRPAYYQLHGHGISEREELNWRVRYRGAGSFIASIRTILGDTPAI